MNLQISIDHTRCTRCTICLDACPVPCYTFHEEENSIIVVNQDQCLVCRNCEETCPVSCIDVIFPY